MIEILDLAGRVGHSLAGDIGKTAFIELELALASRMLPKFSDDPVTRVFQNILLYWQFGYYKSTMLRIFRRVIPKNLKVIDVSSMTFEKICGSINTKTMHIVKPAFTNDIKVVTISELTLLLGTKDAMQHFSNILNAVLEGEEVSRETISLSYGSISEKEMQELETEGVKYDYKRGRLLYKPDVIVLAATRPLENKDFTSLKNYGHLSRYHVIQYQVTQEEASNHLHKNYRLDAKLLEELKNVNEKLGQIKVLKTLRPTEDFTNSLYDDLEDIINDEISKKKIDVSTIINPRLKDDIIRELIAHAFLRTASENKYTDIEELTYTEEDAEFIQSRLHHFVDFQLNPLIAERYTTVSRRPSKKDQAKQYIKEYLADKKIRPRQALVNFVKTKERISTPTIENARKEILEKQEICQPNYGFYKLKEDCTKCIHQPNCSDKRKEK